MSPYLNIVLDWMFGRITESDLDWLLWHDPAFAEWFVSGGYVQ